MTVFTFRPWAFALSALAFSACTRAVPTTTAQGNPSPATATSVALAPTPEAPAATPPPATVLPGPTAAEAAAAQWYLKDPKLDGVPGVGDTRAYAELLKNRAPTAVIVAVIDGGIDTAHVDLKPILWTNAKEIPGNGLDDDKNGYIDDVHGWNFLGGADGRSVGDESLEVTRIVAKYRPRFKGKLRTAVPVAQRPEFDLYTKAEKAFTTRTKQETERAAQVEDMAGPLKMMVGALKKDLGVERLDTATLRKAQSSNENMRNLSRALDQNLRQMGLADTDALEKELESGAKEERNLLDNSLNLSFNPRAEIVKDNPDDVNERFYGNNDLHGPDPLHGTHVSGIIAAVRDNNLGVQGVAGPLVRIMTVRAVPNGDERDKDVANGIRYAVDNGAKVINMSFGKEFSPERPAVEAAFKYAAAHDVLLVHAAGNENDNLDVSNHYPAALTLAGQPFPNLLTVGASSAKDDASLPAEFSNYGKKQVDVFAPGVAIYSTLPGNTYGMESGTSMASPVTAGVAAVLKSYFPTLTAVQLKDIIRRSAQVHHTMVSVPGTDKKADFTTLSITGGVVDLYEAIKLAETVAK
ncbi:S8 family peptidase [Hymenobacter coccineus]|uniref:S8 family peptidase n=1 Tax=Hymenobacter coccineus TaxID=1908235 RepID=UPI0009F44ED3|nr:S8 family peptidase [Hymenobacter coccineus]